RLVGFGSQRLLLRERFGFRLLGFLLLTLSFLLLTGCFLRSLQSLSFRGLCLGAGCFSVGPRSCLCLSVRASLGGTLVGSTLLGGRLCLRFFFILLLNRHHARFLGSLCSFARGGFDGALILFTAISRFRVLHLLICLGDDRRRILIGEGNVGDAHRISR